MLCEKPMAMTLRDCDAMIAAAENAGTTLMVGHVRRYDTDWGTWRSLVEKGVIGRPVLWRQTAGGGHPGNWFMDARMGGGPFMDGCVHNWDFANWVFGQPAEAVASLMRLAKTSAFDTGTVAILFYRLEIYSEQLEHTAGISPHVLKDPVETHCRFLPDRQKDTHHNLYICPNQQKLTYA